MRPRSLTQIAERAATAPQSFDLAAREFLDAWQSMTPEERISALGGEPAMVGGIRDAYLAALAEHLALESRLPVPDWTSEKHRFLAEPYFAGGLESLKALLLVESPLAFRRRLIFISADALSRPAREDDGSGAIVKQRA